MRTTLTTLLVVLLIAGSTAASAMQLGAPDPLDLLASREADPPPGDISDNLEYIATATEATQAIAVNFIGDTMFVSTVVGIFSYDIADPAAPQLLGTLPMYIWENEDMDIDVERELLIISRDPRGFTGVVAPAQARFFGAIQIIDVSNPAAMVQVGFHTLPAGHTSTCIADDADNPDACDFLWTGGPYGSELFGPYGRPIYGTDISDPLNPVDCPEPINTNLMPNGDTGYAHDVQVDDMGIAWVSHQSGVHGYWTFGSHVDPTTGETREATPCDPIPYGGGTSPVEATPSRFMHNSFRNVDATIPDADPAVQEASRGAVLMATEENITSSCAASGRFATYDIRSSLDGSGFADPAGFEMDALDTWTPEAAEGATGCASAHYFEDRGDGLLAYSFYGQGMRLLDVTDPRDIRQVGYFRPDQGDNFASYFHDGHIFIADRSRGVDIIKVRDDEGASTAPALMPTVEAPPLPAAQAERMRLQYSPDPELGYLCPIFTPLQP